MDECNLIFICETDIVYINRVVRIQEEQV